MGVEISAVIVGICAGVVSGLLGVGGGIIIIPALVLLFGFSQHLAQGTALTLMLPPIGIFAVMTYYKQGFVDFKVAVFICLGFLLGSIFGARAATLLPHLFLRKAFGIVMLIGSIKMIFGS